MDLWVFFNQLTLRIKIYLMYKVNCICENTPSPPLVMMILAKAEYYQ